MELLSEPGALLLVALVMATSFTDLRTHKIRNVHVFPVMLVGLILGAVTGGLAGLGWAVLGLVVGGGVMMPLYATGIMKAGDVKLAMALGTLIGPWEAFRTVILSLVLYLPVGLVSLMLRGRLGELVHAVKALGRFLYTRLNPMLVGEPLEMQRVTLAPYGLVLGTAALCVHFLGWLSQQGFFG